MTTATKKDYIQLKDLLLSLRSLYQKNNQDLDELKTNIYGLDSRIQDFYFYVNSYKGEVNPELMLKFIEKRGLLWRIKDSLAQFRGELDTERDTAKVWTDFNKHYKIIGHYPAKIQDEADFRRKIDQLLQSEFYKKIHTPNITVKSEYVEGTLNISKAGVIFYAVDPNSIRNSIYYDGRLDVLEHRLSTSALPGKRVVSLLNTLDAPIKTSDLPLYHQQALSFADNHVSTIQPLDETESDIDIYDLEFPEPKELILRKK